MLQQFIEFFGVEIQAIPERVGLLGGEPAPLDLIFDLLPGLKGWFFIAFGKDESATWKRLFEQLLGDGPVPKRAQCGEFLADRGPADVTTFAFFRRAFGDVFLEFAVGQCAQGFLGSDQPHEMPHVHACRLERRGFQCASRDALPVDREQFTDGYGAELFWLRRQLSIGEQEGWNVRVIWNDESTAFCQPNIFVDSNGRSRRLALICGLQRSLEAQAAVAEADVVGAAGIALERCHE